MFSTFTPFMNSSFNNYTWQSPFSTPWSDSSTKSSKGETYEEYQKRLKKERELAAEEVKIRQSKQEIINEYNQNLKEISTSIKQVENGKNKDGSSTVRSSAKKAGFWGKAGRWLSNLGTSLKNMGKSFIGYKEDGKFSLKKCLKNIGITVLAVGLTFIPVVGPIIGAGMLGTGLIGGSIGIAKGISSLDKAKTDEEIDKAQQDICANAFVSITSLFGIRGLGKGFRTASSTSSQASSATARSGAGKVVENLSNFGRDLAINSGKGIKNAVLEDINSVSRNGFLNATKDKFISTYQSLTSWENLYNEKYTKLKTSIEKKLNKVETDIQKIEQLNRINGQLTSAESQRLALLKEERLLLKENKTELDLYFGRGTNEKSLYDELIKKNSGTYAQERIAHRQASPAPNKVQGQDIPNTELATFYKRIKFEQKEYSNALKDLTRTKENVMRSMAKYPDKNATELANYIPDLNINRRWYNFGKTDYELAMGGRYQRVSGRPKALGLLTLSPASNVPKALGAWVSPIYSGPILFSEDLTPEQTAELLTELEAQSKALKEALKEVEEIKTEAELETYKQQLAQAYTQQTEENTEKKENN